MVGKACWNNGEANKKNYNYTIIRIGSCAGLIIGPGKTTGHLPIKNGRLSYVIMS